MATDAPAASKSLADFTAWAAEHGSFKLSNALPPFWRDEIRQYLRADAPTLDIGGYVVGEEVVTAVLLCKSAPDGSRLMGATAKRACVLAGVPFVDAVFEELGCKIEWLAREGELVESPVAVARVTGPCRMVLLGERTALNILSRASGIATEARGLVNVAKAAGWHGEVAGTRKVTPGFRLVEKYALLVGGAGTHRMDLSSMVMLKDNHVWASGSITAAVYAARSVAGFSTKIEVECRSLDEAMQACTAGADVIMFDNYTPEAMAVDAKALKERFPHVIVEASGGITWETLPRFFSPYIDVVSMGALTHGYAVADYSLKVAKGEGVEAINRVVYRA